MYHLRYPETNSYRILHSHLYTTTPAVDQDIVIPRIESILRRAASCQKSIATWATQQQPPDNKPLKAYYRRCYGLSAVYQHLSNR